MSEDCACGLPLHYTDSIVEANMRSLVASVGEYVNITVGEGTFRVQRHYVALHGIKARDLPLLGFEKVGS